MSRLLSAGLKFNSIERAPKEATKDGANRGPEHRSGLADCCCKAHGLGCWCVSGQFFNYFPFESQLTVGVLAFHLSKTNETATLDKISIVTEIRDSVDILQTPENQPNLLQLLPTLLEILRDTPAAFFTNDPDHVGF